MPKGGIGIGIGGIPIPPIGGGAVKGAVMPGPLPMPGIGGAGKARGSNCAYIFCNKMNERKNNAVILCAIEKWCVYQVWLLKQPL